MIKEQGKVEEINENTALVRIQKRSACAHCGSKDSCSISKRDALIEVPNDLDAGLGDQVEITVPEGTLLRLSALVYLLPVVALLIGAILGTELSGKFGWDSGISSIAGGGILIAAVFGGLIIYDRTRKARDKHSPQMTRILVNAASL